MNKGEWVRRFAIAVAIGLLATGQWAVLLYGAIWYHLARLTVQVLERRSDSADESQVTGTPPGFGP